MSAPACIAAFRAALVVVLACAGLAAQASPRVPGLVLEFARPGGEWVDARPARLLALRVCAGEPASPRLPPGPFVARFSGWLEIALRDRYTFHNAGNGEVELRIDGQEIALGEAVRLRSGAREVELTWTPPAEADARLRLLWEGFDFAPEPISPRLWSHDPSAPLLREGRALRRGRLLLAHHHCLSCHRPPRAFALLPHAMPELGAPGPTLDTAGARLEREWIRRWVLDPRAVRADATMPSLLRGPDAAQQAADIAAHLAQLGAEASLVVVEAAPGAAQRGGVLFAQLGCIGCHTLPDARPDPESDRDGRIALRGVGPKYRPGALARYLLAPHRDHPASAMPDFGLAPPEARALAAFLRHRDPPLRATATPAAPEGDPERGRVLVATLGCAKCHFTGEIGRYRAPAFEQLADLTRGCLAADTRQRGSAPRLDLDPAERAALRMAAAELETLGRDPASELAVRRRATLRCTACHEIDGRASGWAEHRAEIQPLLEGVEPPAQPQLPPSLTFAGEKLRRAWIAKVLEGAAPQVRPWLRARMPAFAVDGARLADGLSAEHGVAVLAPPQVRDPDSAAVGKRLIGAPGGFGCTQCHALGGRPPTSVFEVQGPDLMWAAARLRPLWVRRWLWDPRRIDPSTRMPRYAGGNGKTGFLEIYGGDARAQLDAIWHYLLAGEALRDG